MQCRSHNGGYYYPSYFNVGLSGQNYNVVLPLPNIDPNACYQKEIFRQMMLKHEATFKYQVCELHRVYGRQKELMEEIRKRELLKHDLKSHFASELRPDFSLQPSSSEQCLTKDVSKESEQSSSQTNKSRKRMLDLEVPASEYDDCDEDDVVRTPDVAISESHHQLGSNLDSLSPRGYRNANVFFDLNAPAQPGESDFQSSATLQSQDPTADFKVSESKNLSKVVDLNMLPDDSLSDDDLSGHASVVCDPNHHEREEGETDCSDSKSAIVNALESQQSGLDSSKSSIDTFIDSNVKKELTLTETEAATQRDLDPPASPENKESSPPRKDSQDNQLSSSKIQDEEEEDRAAADTLFAIASSGFQRYSSTKKFEQNEPFCDSLDWFAGIASRFKLVNASVPNKLKGRRRTMKLQAKNVKKEANADPHSISSRRGRRRSKATSEITTCLSSSSSSTQTFLAVWGKTKKRQMARVARSIATR